MLEQLGNEGISVLKTLISQIVTFSLTKIKDREDLSRSFLHKVPEIAQYLKKH